MVERWFVTSEVAGSSPVVFVLYIIIFMLLKRKKPKTPGIRHQLLSDKTVLYTNNKLKSLLIRKKKNAGRNLNGHITIRHRGGGHKLVVRQLEWSNNPSVNIVVGVEYDPNRSGLLARIFDINTKTYKYTLANKMLYPGSKINISTKGSDIRIGNRMPLLNIPAGSIISCVSAGMTSVPIFAKSAGTSCQLLQKGPLFCKIRIPSGKIKFVTSSAMATLGSIANEMHNLQKIGKAGANRHRGIRPTVRGVAMNPVDHPHGGAGGRPSVTPWGKPTKGKPTVLKKK